MFDSPERSRRGSLSLHVVLALAAIVGGSVAIWTYQRNGNDDQDVATVLADTRLRGRDENDDEAVRSVVTKEVATTGTRPTPVAA